MTKENKELLIKELSTRTPYKVKCLFKLSFNNETTDGEEVTTEQIDTIESINFFTKEIESRYYSEWVGVEDCKPYLRPMSSMTEEERDEIEEMSHGWFYVNEDGEIFPMGQFTDSGEFEDAILPILDWLHEHHFDYRGLIEKGLALEAPEGMYKEN